jgi:hypothetical protein
MSRKLPYQKNNRMLPKPMLDRIHPINGFIYAITQVKADTYVANTVIIELRQNTKGVWLCIRKTMSGLCQFIETNISLYGTRHTKHLFGRHSVKHTKCKKHSNSELLISIVKIKE